MINLDTIPHACGIYIMKDRHNEILYIGKAKDLSKRIRSYFTKNILGYKTSTLLSNVSLIEYVITNSEKEALLLESSLIKKIQPKFNVIWRDDKSYPHLKLTLNEPFPRIYLTRKIVNDGSKYFGPYTHVGQVRKLLRRIRKLFPLRMCKHILTSEKIISKKIKPCLYYYINECLGPCTGKISQDEYNKTVTDLILFLDGDFKKLLKSWERKMKYHSRKLEFEKAAIYRDLITTLKNMFSRITFREITKEMLEQRIEVSKALIELKEKLKLPKLPIKIEAFDVSNIFGNEAVGSMVSFFQGLPDKANYKRYQIKTVKKIDDYAMISEIIKRRYERLIKEEKELPDLVIVDGGPGHLSTAINTLKKLKVEIPVISIAKKMEKIFSPYIDEFVILPQDSEALKLIQRVRNEAHRFAISYHKLRRKKAIISTLREK